jgi:hypothetical protein
MSIDCSCGFGARYDLGVFSIAWHTAHRDHHLAVFPDVDQGTIDNLEQAITYAERSTQ